MKKFLTLLLTLLFLVSSACAADEACVYVSISDGEGNLVLAHEAITVSDVDGDGLLTIADALQCAHEQQYETGAEGFAFESTEYGLSMTRLWGVENGGSYGYCLNNASAWSLQDPVAEGDHVKAYPYTDLIAWSDTYTYFNADAITTPAGDVTLTLTANGYDENYAPITFAVADATITVNGEVTDIVTDAEGAATLTFTEAGAYVVSATSDNMTLVSPVCIITIE